MTTNKTTGKGSTGANPKTLEPKAPPAPAPVAPTADPVEETVAPLPSINPDSLLVPCQFKAKEDITAYELAVLLHYLMNKQLTYGDWKTLEKNHDGITRHLIPIQNLPAPEEIPESDGE